ncbi:hypothetical protein PHYPSEUDO_013699 [Phytophthora pseudosyringae]|uniref:RxLR effector protein n=1 Tax=Phytophthora pseudosyringae TaxID=221518 RepID=A0A8T1V9X8_9STRA|nr:hypothetical protein PHYPSEUDO_013699 [Phytophthora pseudosyringae]
MRLQIVAALVAATLFGSSDASALVSSNSLLTRPASASSLRFLRAGTTTDEQERGVSLVIAGSGKTADQAFTLLQLDKAGENLFSHAEFKSWTKYMGTINKEHPSAAMAASLSARYGDEGLQKMLEAAKEVPRTQKIATKLQVAQLESWASTSKPANDVLTLLKLDGGVEKLLTNPNLNFLATYTTLFNKNHPGKETTMISTLTTYYGDKSVAKMLQAAKKVPSTEKMAKELQTAQFSQWLKEGAQPAQVLKMLKLNQQNLKTSPNGEIYSGYLAYINKLQ